MQFNEFVGFKSSCGVKACLESIVYYPYHLHSTVLEIICVLNGKFHISDCAHDHILSHGDVYFFNAKDSHKIERLEKNSVLLTVHMDLEHFRPMFRKFQGNDYDILEMSYFICDSFQYPDQYSLDIKHLRFLLAKIYMEYHSDCFSDHRLEELGKEFLVYILEHYQNYLYSKLEDGKYVIIKRDVFRENPADYEKIYDIIDFIYENFRRKVTLDEIAEREFLNPSYLSTYIKRSSGLTFSEILALARCEEAERLLSDTDKTMDQIAEEVGFSNRSHLTNQFKKWFHKSPSQYRKNIRQDLLGSGNIRYDTFDYDFAMKIINAYLDGY